MSGARTAVVTGATGFVGSHFVPRLLADGWRVAVVQRPSSQLPEAWRGDVTVILDNGDVEELTQALGAFSPSVCFHLATYFVGVHTKADVSPLVAANVDFGTRLLDALSGVDGLSFVNVGTVWQHYEGRDYGPTSLYAATKQAFADIVQFYAECTGIRAVTVELTDTYGPDDTRKKLLPFLVQTAETGTPLPMSPGEQLFDIVHVDDVANALLAAVPLASHEAPTFSVSSRATLPLRQFVELVADIIGKPIPVEWGARPYRPREMLQPWRATPDLPGWSPQVPLREGLQRVLDDRLR